jgi:hypothetical protein
MASARRSGIGSTRNYSGPALAAAGAICILLSFVGKLSAFVGTVPVFVSGGLALYLFGAVGMQGMLGPRSARSLAPEAPRAPSVLREPSAPSAPEAPERREVETPAT